MNVTEFQVQCLKLLEAAREWSDEQWEQLQDSCTMDVLDSFIELEHQLEN